MTGALQCPVFNSIKELKSSKVQLTAIIFSSLANFKNLKNIH